MIDREITYAEHVEIENQLMLSRLEFEKRDLNDFKALRINKFNFKLLALLVSALMWVGIFKMWGEL